MYTNGALYFPHDPQSHLPSPTLTHIPLVDETPDADNVSPLAPFFSLGFTTLDDLLDMADQNYAQLEGNFTPEEVQEFNKLSDCAQPTVTRVGPGAGACGFAQPPWVPPAGFPQAPLFPTLQEIPSSEFAITTPPASDSGSLPDLKPHWTPEPCPSDLQTRQHSSSRKSGESRRGSISVLVSPDVTCIPPSSAHRCKGESLDTLSTRDNSNPSQTLKRTAPPIDEAAGDASEPIPLQPPPSPKPSPQPDVVIVTSSPPQRPNKRLRTSSKTKASATARAAQPSESPANTPRPGPAPAPRPTTKRRQRSSGPDAEIHIPRGHKLTDVDGVLEMEGLDDATRRRLRNTLSARRSRMRKVTRLTELETRVAELERENAELRDTIAFSEGRIEFTAGAGTSEVGNSGVRTGERGEGGEETHFDPKKEFLAGRMPVVDGGEEQEQGERQRWLENVPRTDDARISAGAW
ncbi:hypothetical protein M427DRAFT_219596 [Gonapodya prolifera JEL478]|uniref:BZIP domain-containing protein n=1 Tax=Gonapodya prolifera (strain JEL478) TaxID=1344416 RepID=A0A138ZZE8_GONPJ|nr:hypothetical protein M427DRAFT_219596 [Gonapodya prolifera JEL478]|eukprot:KXS09645.1 hypothetical protein M427DRAFT_219596 [Gonapodya prolifera JEL478]